MTLAVLALTALPFVVTPGASFALTVGAVGRAGRCAPAKVWAGTTLGIITIASIAALSGIGQFLGTHPTARVMFGVVGGAILVLLGIVTGLRALSSIRSPTIDTRPPRRLILSAFLALVTNIKAVSLYALVVPTLRSEGLGGTSLFLAFAAVHAMLLLVWLSLLGEGIRRIPRIGTSPRVRAGLAALAALTLMAIGTQTLLQSLC